MICGHFRPESRASPPFECLASAIINLPHRFLVGPAAFSLNKKEEDLTTERAVFQDYVRLRR